jgi:hypothetical protein
MSRLRPSGLVVAAVLLAPLSGCATPTSSERPEPSPSPTSSAAPTTPSGEVSAAERATSVPEPQAPRLAVLPSGRRVPVSTVGTTPTGTLAVPDDIDVAGWWRGGSRLGDPFGSVLVAAHVDSHTQGLGPFAELLTVTAGSRVRLESAGLRQTFEVRSRRLVPQGSLVDDSWIFGASGDLRLTLVTCAPPYDASRGGYQNLAVVTARPLGPPEATS